MSQCKRCKGTKKLYRITAKCSDSYVQSHLNSDTDDYQGYVPDWLGKWGDYVEFIICRHCGQVAGDWPEADKKANQFKSGKVVV